MWMKWHHKFADGPSSPEWIYLGGSGPVCEIAKETGRELSEEYCWSEHYRGVAYDLVETPPVDVVRAQLARAERALEHQRKRVLALQAELQRALEAL